MKKYLTLFAFVMIASTLIGLSSLSSCSGGGIKEKTIPGGFIDRDINGTVASMNVSHVEKESYLFSIDKNNPSVVEIKLVFEAPAMFYGGNITDNIFTEDNFCVIPLNANQVPFKDKDNNDIHFKPITLPNSAGWETIFNYDFETSEKAEEFLTNVTTFKLYYYLNEFPNTDEPELIIDSNMDWDAFLSDYEEIVNSYEKYVSELKSGNVDVASSMEMATKAQTIQSKISENMSALTPKQTQRFTKIMNRLATVAAKASTINAKDIQTINGVDISQYQ